MGTAAPTQIKAEQVKYVFGSKVNRLKIRQRENLGSCKRNFQWFDEFNNRHDWRKTREIQEVKRINYQLGRRQSCVPNMVKYRFSL
jgi:hypothetical protein